MYELGLIADPTCGCGENTESARLFDCINVEHHRKKLKDRTGLGEDDWPCDPQDFKTDETIWKNFENYVTACLQEKKRSTPE